MRGLGARISAAGARPVSTASLAVFRVAFGIAMAYNALLYAVPSRVRDYYVEPSINFPYPPFSFVTPVPGDWMYAVYAGMVLTGLLIAVGLWYRVAMAAFFVLTTYVFLLDSTYYQNHEYLVSLLAFLMIFLPAHRMWSVDAWRSSRVASETVSAWVVWLLRFQIGVPYFFGGVAKLNFDWLRGEPLRMWLERRTHVEVIGPLFSNEAVVFFMAYGSLVFDLAVVWFLLYHRTRIAAFAVATAFHLLNARLWGLYIFPWLMIAATTIYFSPDWPLRVRSKLEQWWPRLRSLPGRATRPVGGGATGGEGAPRMAPVLVLFLAAWMAVQVLLPFRHFTMPGSVHWTEQGHRFAWHMMLREKSGTATFFVADGEGPREVNPRDYLGDRQAARLPGHPERLVQFSRELAERYDATEVRVETWVSLNGREPQRIVDPEANLAEVSLPRWGEAEWLVPLEQPLRPD